MNELNNQLLFNKIQLGSSVDQLSLSNQYKLNGLSSASLSISSNLINIDMSILKNIDEIKADDSSKQDEDEDEDNNNNDDEDDDDDEDEDENFKKTKLDDLLAAASLSTPEKKYYSMENQIKMNSDEHIDDDTGFDFDNLLKATEDDSNKHKFMPSSISTAPAALSFQEKYSLKRQSNGVQSNLCQYGYLNQANISTSANGFAGASSSTSSPNINNNNNKYQPNKKQLTYNTKSSTYSSSSGSSTTSSSSSTGTNEIPIFTNCSNQRIINTSLITRQSSVGHSNVIPTSNTYTNNLKQIQNTNNHTGSKVSSSASSPSIKPKLQQTTSVDASLLASAASAAIATPPTPTSKPQQFNIENELIKYTKNLKLNNQSYLNTYKLGDHIRNGGFSEIYEGTHSKTNERVIIKLIPKHKTKNWLMVHNKKYPAEVLLHKMCNNISGVVRMIEFFEQEHEWIIIMPKLNNCMDLFDYLESKQRGRLTEPEACNFFKQLIQINIDLLNQGVVHRDIKSENLLVDMDTMKIILIDFGASAIYRHNTNGHPHQSQHLYTDFHGTRQYKPPEYITHKKYTAQSSTIWTLGILLYDMCNGQLPFETEQEILDYNLNIKANVSDEYREILYDCLKKDPSSRPQLHQLLEYSWCITNSKPAEPAANPSKAQYKNNSSNLTSSSSSTTSSSTPSTSATIIHKHNIKT